MNTPVDTVDIVLRMRADRPQSVLMAALRAVAAIEESELKASFEEGRQVYSLLPIELPRVASLDAYRKLRDARLAEQIFAKGRTT